MNAKLPTLDEMVTLLGRQFDSLPDPRAGPNLTYTLRDAGLAAFAVFFMQAPSFLAHQRDMQRQKGRNNAASLFGVCAIPSDPQIRNLLDPLPPAQLAAPFWAVFDRLAQKGALLRYESFAANWLCSFDGTQFFTSTKIHCERCSVKVQNGQTHYAHTAITPVLVAPGESRVLTLEPEFSTPQDGQEKQDCERNAAKRWLTRHRDRFGNHAVTYLGDDLYSNQPFCEQVCAAKQQHFIFTCKPDSHTTLYEEVALLNRLGAVSQVSDRHWTGRTHERWTYRYVNAVPLRAGADALLVNWCELTITQEATGQLLYQNAWITDHVLSDQTVRPLVAAGRARWKIENENNNVLKNHGYHLEHNFGHGHHYLAQVLVLLNLLAFLMHTVLDLGDEAYQRIRRELGTRQTFFNDIQALTRYWFFANWQQLLDFMAAGLELRPAPT
jgi:hypothetical protein